MLAGSASDRDDRDKRLRENEDRRPQYYRCNQQENAQIDADAEWPES